MVGSWATNPTSVTYAPWLIAASSLGSRRPDATGSPSPCRTALRTAGYGVALWITPLKGLTCGQLFANDTRMRDTARPADRSGFRAGWGGWEAGRLGRLAGWGGWPAGEAGRLGKLACRRGWPAGEAGRGGWPGRLWRIAYARAWVGAHAAPKEVACVRRRAGRRTGPVVGGRGDG